MSWVQLYIDWESESRRISVDTMDDNDNTVGNRSYRGLATSICLARGAQIADEKGLRSWIEEELGAEIREILTHFETYERNGELYGTWNDEGEALRKFEDRMEEELDYFDASCSAAVMGLFAEYAADQYLAECGVHKGGTVCRYALTHASTDKYISEMASVIDDDAKDNGCALDGTEKYLTKCRDDMREEWEDAHTCPICGTRAPAIYDTEDEPSWDCSVCAEDEDEELGTPIGR